MQTLLSVPLRADAPTPPQLRWGGSDYAISESALAGREQAGHVSPSSPQNLAVRGLVARVAQYAAGEVAGVGAFLHQHPAVDEGGVDAGRRLLEAPAAGREIVHDELGQRLDRVGVEHGDVGDHAGAQ